MVKNLFIVTLFLLALQIEARPEQQEKLKVEWVKDLKTFLLAVEKENPELLDTTAASREVHLSLFQQAFAASRYDCFFAGWPSSLVKSGNKKLCQSPSRGNKEYSKGSCPSGQLQCQPSLFGKDICVSFSSSSDKQKAFASCESKFQKKNDYSFLKSLGAQEKEALKEISLLVKDVCLSGKVGVQKARPMCKNLLARADKVIKSLDRAPASTAAVEAVLVKSQVPLMKQKEEVICEQVVVDRKIAEQSEVIINTVNSETDQLYGEIKKEFENSPLCAPDKVMNDPKDKLSPILFKQLNDDMRFIVNGDPNLSREAKIRIFKNTAADYQISQDVIKYGEELLKNYQDTSSGRYDAMARLRGVMLQDMDKISKRVSGYQSEMIREGLLERGIFFEDDEGNIVCPFLSPEAFRDALAGREAVMKSVHKSKISRPNLITVVDYSRPSNERRMFVIDLESKKVLHNTWVAHGGGTDRSQEAGPHNDGSSPATSNSNGSLLSSEGFYLARAASFGDKYLNNITLEGIDKSNKSMGPRAIVVHGWRTPNHDYLNKTWQMSEGKSPKRVEGKDIYKEFMRIDFKNTKEDLFNLTTDLSTAAAGRPYVDATDGCLGVPETPMGHVDRKGRDKSQLELLREDLPGSLMFNYTGAGKTKSNYLH